MLGLPILKTINFAKNVFRIGNLAQILMDKTLLLHREKYAEVSINANTRSLELELLCGFGKILP